MGGSTTKHKNPENHARESDDLPCHRDFLIQESRTIFKKQGLQRIRFLQVRLEAFFGACTDTHTFHV